MNLTRREALALGMSAVLSSGVLAAETATKRLGVVLYSYSIRRAHPPQGEGPRFDDPCDFLDHCVSLGAAGIQTSLGARDATYAAKLRAKAEKHGMYVEGIVGLPRDEAGVKRLESELRFARECGVTVLRTTLVGDRRYEKFDTKAAFETATKKALEALSAAAPLVEKHQLRLAVENHKDFRTAELLGHLKHYDPKFIGICLDTGNNVALLEQPTDVVKGLAERTFTIHLKDMAVADYADGFLLAETPLGEGFLNLKQLIALVEAKAPRGLHWNLEMITRDPLRVPCLTPKYWQTMDDVSALDFAERLAKIRAKKSNAPLPMLSTRSIAEQMEMEEANVRKCFQYARQQWQG